LEVPEMINWNGVSLAIDNAVSKAQEAIKQKKTRIWVVAGIIALGIILFIRKK
jgi:hypothetical protein